MIVRTRVLNEQEEGSRRVVVVVVVICHSYDVLVCGGTCVWVCMM